MVQNDGTKPVSYLRIIAQAAIFNIDSNPYTFLAQWIWVRRPAEPTDQLRQEGSEEEAVKEASILCP